MNATGSRAARGVVSGLRGSLVRADIVEGSAVKNEVAWVHAAGRRLKAEVLRIRGPRAELQVFEDPVGMRVGDAVELTGRPLEAVLGPGLLGQVFDGLQNPLAVLKARHGFFLERGASADALDPERTWEFTPAVEPGASVDPGSVLGSFREGALTLRLVVPAEAGEGARVSAIERGAFAVDTPVARLQTATGTVLPVTLRRRWPVREPMARALVRGGLARRIEPAEPLVTTLRLIDTFFPVARGGTACIPGPFGAGKTVLQGLIARYAAADVVVIVACGERAGEVVETITELPRLTDPRTGRSLMERTIIVCNTSSMPVAARESSLHTGLALGEYYREMGLDALVIADSTSRWAQALRELSGLMEEIPGDEAFPPYLDSAIKGLYDRAGVIAYPDGRSGSVTLVGTVSPAGGNLEEPVTQSTLAAVRCFLGLSSERAYRRQYPAIDPLLSWSRYLDTLAPALEAAQGAGWVARVRRLATLLRRGEEVAQLVQVTGEEGVGQEDYVLWLGARLLDDVFLQQDAFDPVDVSSPPAVQRELLELVEEVLQAARVFPDKPSARERFAALESALRTLNGLAPGTQERAGQVVRVRTLAAGEAA